MKIALITAMDIEYRHLVAMLGGQPAGRHGDHEVVASMSGIGKVNAALTAQRLILEQHPDCIVSTGLAGGLDHSLRPGDLVIGSQCAYHDVWCSMGNEWGQVQGLPTRFDADAQLLAAARQVSTTSTVREGLIVTGDQFVDTADGVAAIRQHVPDALACEMESTAIAQTCHLHQVPFLAVRLISDTPGATADHARQWETFLSEMSDQSFVWVKAFLEKVKTRPRSSAE